jgi:hypothetical protein
MNCPSCQTENTRKQKVIYEEESIEGTSDFLDGETVTHQSKTKLAGQCAPPERPWPSIFFHLLAIIGIPILMANIVDYFPEFISVFLKSFQGTSGILIVLPFIFSVYVLRYIIWSKQLWEEYYIEHLSWKNSWLCLKCGHKFEQS